MSTQWTPKRLSRRVGELPTARRGRIAFSTRAGSLGQPVAAIRLTGFTGCADERLGVFDGDCWTLCGCRSVSIGNPSPRVLDNGGRATGIVAVSKRYREFGLCGFDFC